jgi:hypothetical protein
LVAGTKNNLNTCVFVISAVVFACLCPSFMCVCVCVCVCVTLNYGGNICSVILMVLAYSGIASCFLLK